MNLVAGVDFGTDSVRVGVWDVTTGECRAAVARRYRRWAQGLYCRPELQQFRQHPLDHLEALEDAFGAIADELGEGSVAALAVDSTGSTPAPTNAAGVPLALLPEHAEDPDCMFWLWKDHSASAAAARINDVLPAHDPDYSTYQGIYSSEWWWAKILQAATARPRLREVAASWIEHADWVPHLLTGGSSAVDAARGTCAAGHKALFNRRLGGAVPTSILDQLDPYLSVVGRTMRTPVVAGTPLGTLTPEWVRRLRLSTDTVVGMGSLDAHAGAVGAGVAPGTMVKVLGTSSVDMFLTSYDAVDGVSLRGLCAVAEDSIVPGHLGGEASQAAFGDLFAWFASVLMWPARQLLASSVERAYEGRLTVSEVDDLVAMTASDLLPALEREAVRRGPSGVVAVDWINGRRYPFDDDTATASLLGLRIGHDAVDLYRALVQSAVLGSRAIVDSIPTSVLDVRRIILVGGIAKRSPMICQGLADALDAEVMVSPAAEVCARGAAIYAAVASGAFATVADAQAALCEDYQVDYRPTDAGREEYRRAYADYRRAAEATAGLRGEGEPM